MSNSSLTSLKLSFNGEIRRLSVATDSLTYQDLVTKTLSVFPQLTSIQFSWADDEDDKVTVRSEEELAEALRVMTGTKKGYLRFDVHEMTVNKGNRRKPTSSRFIAAQTAADKAKTFGARQGGKGSTYRDAPNNTASLLASNMVNREQSCSYRPLVAQAAAEKARSLGSTQDGCYQSIRRDKGRVQRDGTKKKDCWDRSSVARAAAGKARTFGFGQDERYLSTRSSKAGAQVSNKTGITARDCWGRPFVAQAAADKAKTMGPRQDEGYQSTQRSKGYSSKTADNSTNVKKEKACWDRSSVAQAAADRAKAFGLGQNESCQHTYKENTLVSECARWSHELHVLAAMGFSDTNKVLPVLKTHIAVPECERIKGISTRNTEGLQAVVLALVSCAE